MAVVGGTTTSRGTRGTIGVSTAAGLCLVKAANGQRPDQLAQSNGHLSRDRLYEEVRSRNPSSIISKKLLAWSGSSSYEATEKAWNSLAEAYQRHLCVSPLRQTRIPEPAPHLFPS